VVNTLKHNVWRRVPEPPTVASQLAGSNLLERFQKLRHEDDWRLVDQQVNMFRHQHVSVNPGLMTCPGLFQNGFDRFLGAPCFEERETVKATERDEMKSLRSLKTASGRMAYCHRNPATLSGDPLIAIKPR
jgi:hypothetical protein